MTDTVQGGWKGRQVEFVLRDVYLPEPVKVLDELCGGDRLHGRGLHPLAGEVIDETADGRTGGGFVLVRCERLREPCLVAVEHVRAVE